MIDYSDLLDDLYDEIDYRWGKQVDEPANYVACPTCEGHIHFSFGTWLGNLLWFTCPFCGVWFSTTVD